LQLLLSLAAYCGFLQQLRMVVAYYHFMKRLGHELLFTICITYVTDLFCMINSESKNNGKTECCFKESSKSKFVYG